MIIVLVSIELKPKIFQGGTFEDFTTTKAHNHNICLTRDKSTFFCQSNVPPQTGVCPHPWVPGVSDYRTGYNTLARRF